MGHGKHKHGGTHHHPGDRHDHKPAKDAKNADVPMTQQRAGLATILAGALAILGLIAVLVVVIWLVVG
jgi:hypothetical protein